MCGCQKKKVSFSILCGYKEGQIFVQGLYVIDFCIKLDFQVSSFMQISLHFLMNPIRKRVFLNRAGIHLVKVNIKNIRTRYEICSKLTIKTAGRRQWRRSGVFVVNFEHISHLALVFLLLTLNM